MKKVAITGLPGSGKSLACQLLKEYYGAFILSSDAIVHDLIAHDKEVKNKICLSFGKEALDRDNLAKKVFAKEKELLKLEEILHPRVLQKIKQVYREIEKSCDYSLFVVEVPLLFEVGFESFFDVTIALVALDETCKKRFGKEDFEKRTARHFSTQKKKELATFSIKNEGSVEDLKEALKIVTKLI